ncbi:MAG: prolyl aminopeptidase [Candidatus Eremiobacteraeota bacterium]|nr:prolyl aminopeptidase [Candidatus Eremiobacteraeota bacterium]
MAEPFEKGMLDVGDGHRVYWECCGNENGKPAIYLHGGPGSGCSAGSRNLFDLARYRAVLMDQRGCGRSLPLVGDSRDDLAANTTQHLIADIEKLRLHLGISKWTVLGLSWGSTLALAYAQAHPDSVEGVVLGLVTTTSRREVQWLTQDVGRIFPQQWDRFAGFIPSTLRARPLVEAYATLLYDPDPAIRAEAARHWCAWEDAHVSLSPNFRPNPRFEDPDFRLRFARLVTHYWSNAAFLTEDQLLRDASVLNGIPGFMVHGRYDVSSPLETAWRLSQNWTTSKLMLLDDAGHDGGHQFLDAIAEGFAFVSR